MTAFWMRSGFLGAKDGLVAKCWDLSDAYKQVPLSDEASHLDSYLAVYDPDCLAANLQAVCFAFWAHSICHSLPSCLSCTVESWIHPPPFAMVGVVR